MTRLSVEDPAHTFAQRLREGSGDGSAVFGAWLTVNCPPILEILGATDIGYIGVDCQHGLLSESDAAAMLARLAPATAGRLVRVSRNDPAYIGSVLDAGADGVIVPAVNDAAEAQAAVEAARFPPLGERSYGPIATYLPSDHLQLADRALVLPMIETRRGLEAVDEILAVDGVDGIYVGPADLGIALGYGSAQFPPTGDLRAVLERIAVASDSARKVAGVHAGSEHFAEIYRALGYGLITLGTERAILTAGVAHVCEVATGPSQLATDAPAHLAPY